MSSDLFVFSGDNVPPINEQMSRLVPSLRRKSGHFFDDQLGGASFMVDWTDSRRSSNRTNIG